ncbi:MAG: SIS domain-containing protein [Chloroflexota bacterium]|nr:MAG: SIS domain-containing protein [Chloroflexota bacterium]
MARVIGALAGEEIERIVDAVLTTRNRGRKIILCGNGGSAATASHFACDLAKGTAVPGERRLCVIALTDNVPLLTAWGNDSDYADVFSEQLRNLVQEGDLVVAISGSGNSPNVLRAVTVAHEAGAMTIGLCGFEGGKLAQLVRMPLVVRSDSMERIEDAHMIICHAVAVGVRERLRSALEASVAV